MKKKNGQVMNTKIKWQRSHQCKGRDLIFRHSKGLRAALLKDCEPCVWHKRPHDLGQARSKMTCLLF